MKAGGLLGATAAVLLGLVACNYTDGECFPRDQLYETAGVGGSGPILPTGSGGFGDVPKGPQNAPPEPDAPICNRISGGPCDDECQAKYDQASIACGKIEDAAQRRSCQDAAHTEYKACQDKCEQQPSNDCMSKWHYCADKAPSSCTRKWNKAQFCTYCLDECKRGSWSRECGACGF